MMLLQVFLYVTIALVECKRFSAPKNIFKNQYPSKSFRKKNNLFILDIPSSWVKTGGPIKISFLGIPEVGEKQWPGKRLDQNPDSAQKDLFYLCFFCPHV